jgi:hypothetical protein
MCVDLPRQNIAGISEPWSDLRWGNLLSRYATPLPRESAAKVRPFAGGTSDLLASCPRYQEFSKIPTRGADTRTTPYPACSLLIEL